MICNIIFDITEKNYNLLNEYGNCSQSGQKIKLID